MKKEETKFRFKNIAKPIKCIFRYLTIGKLMKKDLKRLYLTHYSPVFLIHTPRKHDVSDVFRWVSIGNIGL